MALSPASSRGTASPLSAPVTISETDATSKGLVINTTGAFDVNALEVNAPHTTFRMDGDGIVYLASDDTLGIVCEGLGGTGASLAVQNAVSGLNCGLDSEGGFSANIQGTRLVTLGLLFQFHFTAAPANSDLEAGDCALWFDQTNGAAKLMVKAKQANGTVVTGSLALA